ncbi:testis-specific serine/threonine-protein kinase 5-like [Pristis pectinata]|uniref:testis-specific serine/threonine-protein kinase 5-like n=1 Tax=Pristis pectinata TaxID=685728 RepID=UPI00223CF884|nr:testis-specific serine/threonine-protein kinase 5-like [Pristis pectinata]
MRIWKGDSGKQFALSDEGQQESPSEPSMGRRHVRARATFEIRRPERAAEGSRQLSKLRSLPLRLHLRASPWGRLAVAGMDEVSECRERGYLLTQKRIGLGSSPGVTWHPHPAEGQLQRPTGVWAGKPEGQEGEVAIKIIPISQTLQQQSRRCLSREINALQITYKHPNVIQLYESFRSPSRLYLVLELASRGDLLEHINRTADRSQAVGLREAEAQQMFQQLVGAVYHCHTKHIAHRDLKCENVLLDEKGCVKLTDFGLASKCSKNSLMSTFCGSIPYMAPEILQGLRYRGDHADIWSMGIILYAMVTGKLPFNEFQPCKLLEEIKSGVLYHDRLSPACQDLINKMLQWTPSARLALSEILVHPWMLPAASLLFQKVQLFVAESPPKKQEKETAAKGRSLPPARTPKGKKVLTISGDPHADEKLVSPRRTGPGLASPQPGGWVRPTSRERAPPSRLVELFTRVPRPPTASKPPRPGARKRPVSACSWNAELGHKVPGSQDWTLCLDLSKSAHHISPLADYLPRRLKGF